MEICDSRHCTGCGMCSNICPHNAIEMKEGEHGFIYPHIYEDKCINCGLCKKKCPANAEKQTECTMKKVYAAWNAAKTARKQSTSGGICSLLEDEILEDGGAIAGVRWDADFHAEHTLAFEKKQTEGFRGSKYVQSRTGDIYIKVKELLENGKKVLFTGTPCQVAALKSFLGKDYSGLFTVDLVCHGVPAYEGFNRYLNEVSSAYNKNIVNVRLRYKSPCWDYCKVRIDFEDGTDYSKYTVDDPYFTLFNIGYSLRESCHTCKYASSHREGDITLADFWGYQPSGFRMRNYNKGVSLVLVNTDRGEELFERIEGKIRFEASTVEAALKTNNSLSKPFSPPYDAVIRFWDDYEDGEFSTLDLRRKYVPNPFKLPNLLFLRRLKSRYRWVIKRK